MNRVEFQELAVVRIAEAKALLDAGHFDGAYYLAGYAVECALKACVARLTKPDDFPPHHGVVAKYYTHNVEVLVEHALLNPMRTQDFQANPALAANWAIAKRWSEGSRYTRVTAADANRLYDAIADPADGVLAWIKNYW